MSVYFVSLLRVKDTAKLAEYRKTVGPMIRAHGAELLVKSDVKLADIQGRLDADSVLIFSFPSEQAARDWYDSPEYRALLPLRTAAFDGEFALFEA